MVADHPALARHPDYVSPARTATMLALLGVYLDEGRATVRAVAARRGHASSWGTTHYQLQRLRTELGLVAWDAGTAGTLRPTVVPLSLAAAAALAAGQPALSGAAGPPGGD